MKNMYLSKEQLERLSKVKVVSECPASKVFGYDEKSAELYEKLNPVLSNGHRMNPISVLMDPSIPKEVSTSLLQFVEKLPAGTNFNDLSDEELLDTLPSRYMQSQPQLDAVRDALTIYAAQRGIGNPTESTSTESTSTEPNPTE